MALCISAVSESCLVHSTSQALQRQHVLQALYMALGHDSKLGPALQQGLACTLRFINTESSTLLPRAWLLEASPAAAGPCPFAGEMFSSELFLPGLWLPSAA